MDPAPQRLIRSLPREFASKNGQPARLEVLEPAGHRALVDMYLAFQPRNSFQGLPPASDAVLVRWVGDMVRTGVNVIARAPASDSMILGHIALFPINPQKCELLVVVSPPYQNAGIGTELVRACIDAACELGFERIWLPVAARNLRARHVYRKCGFEYVSDKQSRELDMVLDLNLYRGKVKRADVLAKAVSRPLAHVVTAAFSAGGASAGVDVS